VESGGKQVRSPYWRFVQAGTVRGMRVESRGEECGKVHELVLERGSGEIAFLSIDPNQNFLGISDTKRLVPWSICSIALDGVVRIDASKDMILASSEMPAKVADLNIGGRAAAVYAAYQVPAPSFEPVKPAPVSAANTDDSWSRNGPALSAIDRSADAQVRGPIVEITEVTFDGGIRPATAIKIKDGSEDKVILLGPAWYLEKQEPRLKSGDPVEVEISRARINGKEYWLARTLTRNGSRVVLIDPNGGTPAWDRK
jgi:sporulation protein YlmC with PRC-barrel domain